jgi:hypothetical protein
MLMLRLLPVAVVTVVCLVLGGTALAASDSKPQVGTFYDQFVDSFTITDAPCFEGQAGQAHVTVTVSVHYNNNPDFFHMAGTETQDIRVDFPDGTYLLGGTIARLEESANAQATYLKDTHIERGQATYYAADGSQIGPVSWQSTSHATWQDLNGNHELDPGEVTGGIDQLRILSCP